MWVAGVGQGAMWRGQTTQKTADKKSFGAARGPALALSSSIIMIKCVTGGGQSAGVACQTDCQRYSGICSKPYAITPPIVFKC